MRADVLLLRPKGKETDSRVFAMEQLGLSCLAAAGRSQGLSVEIVDGFLEPSRYDNTLATIATGDCYLLGYPIYPETVRRVARDVDHLRKRGVWTHVTIGNHLATLHDTGVLQDFPQFDSAIRGEGEATLVELAEAIIHSGDFSRIAGLTYRSETELKRNPPRPNFSDLDQLPFPARDTLPLVLQTGNVPLIYSSRGCRARCDFCSVQKFFRASPGGAWRGRSPSNVVDEMESLAVTYGVTEFAFADEQFMGHGPEGVRRALGIAQELLDRKLNFTWYIETRASDIRYDVFVKLREAGLRVVFMGLESGFDLALQQLRKGLTVARSFAALRVLHELEILPTAGFIMFRPTTTPDEIECNLNFLEEVGCVELTALVTRLRAYSGTDFEASLRRSGQRTGASYESDWAFCDKRVEDCFRVVLESADTLSASFNEFARFRRQGRLSYSECLKLQRVMNAEPIGIVRDLLREIVACGGASEETRRKTRTRFKSACEDFLRLLRLVEIVALQRQLDDGVRLLSPMYLC